MFPLQYAFIFENIDKENCLFTIEPGLALVPLPPANGFDGAAAADVDGSALLSALAAADVFGAVASVFMVDVVAYVVFASLEVCVEVGAMSLNSCVGTANSKILENFYHPVLTICWCFTV